MHDRLFDDIFAHIAGFLDHDSYLILRSTCRFTRKALPLTYQHAIERMKRLIYEERVKTTDTKFILSKNNECSEDGVLLFQRHMFNGSIFKTCYQVKIDNFTHEEHKTIKISLSRRFYTYPDDDFEWSNPIGYAYAIIIPCIHEPFKSGNIQLVWYLDNKIGRVVKQYDEVIEYTNGFHEILHELACDMCPLMQDFGRPV
jgi:hypothetical protein